MLYNNFQINSQSQRFNKTLKTLAKIAKKLKTPKKAIETTNENKRLESFRRIKQEIPPNMLIPTNTPTKKSKTLSRKCVFIALIPKLIRHDLALESILPQQDIHK